MSSIVSITPSDSIVECEVGAVSGAAFRVRNISGKPIKVGAQVVAEPAQRPWISIDGQAERQLSANGEATFEVLVSPPADAPPGRYRFGLLVFDSVEPGERFDESPPVELNLVATAIPPRSPSRSNSPRQRRGWRMTLGVFVTTVLLFGAIGILAYFAIDDSSAKSRTLWGILSAGAFSATLAAAATWFVRPWWFVGVSAMVFLIQAFIQALFNLLMPIELGWIVSLALLFLYVHLWRKFSPTRHS